MCHFEWQSFLMLAKYPALLKGVHRDGRDQDQGGPMAPRAGQGRAKVIENTKVDRNVNG